MYLMYYFFILINIFIEQVISENIHIGGLFDENNNSNEIFNFAIRNVNKNNADGDADPEQKLISITNRINPNKPFYALLKTCSLLSLGTVAIFGPRNADNINAVQSICDAKEIPHIITRWNQNVLRGSTTINLYPHPPVLSRAYFDIITAWDWNTFTVLYENNESLLRLADLITNCQLKSILVSVKQLDQPQSGSYIQTFKEARISGQKNFVIDCQVEQLEDVLRQAQQVGLMNHEFNYFITNLDLHTIDLSYFQHSEANITGIRLINPENEYVNQIVNDLHEDITDIENDSSKLQTELALIIDAVSMFARALNNIETPYITKEMHCNNSESWEDGLTVINVMKNSIYKGLTGLVSFDHEGYRSDFELEVLELKEPGLTKIGKWNSSYGLNVTWFSTGFDDADSGSLRNKTFVVITCLTAPYGMLKETHELLYGNDRFEGFGIDLIHELSLMEGFNYTFIIREDKSNGVKNQETGRWSGMIGDLIDYKADLAITDLTITSDRADAVDFTSPFMNLGISILFRKSGKAPPNFFSFAEPFAVDTWMMLGLAYVVVSIALFVMGRLCPDEWNNPYPCIEEPEFLVNQFSFRNAFWFTIGSLMQQGTEIAPIAISTRMVAGMWWFFVLIIVSSYTANLAAFLTTENPIELFTDVESLVANSPQFGIRYGAKENGATYNFFKESTIPIYNKIYEHMKDHPEDLVKENKDGVTLAESAIYAFFMESTSIEYETERRCNLTQYGKLLDNKGYGIAMRKDSSYRKRLSTAVLKLQSSGKLDILKRKWWEERRGGGQCAGDQESANATPLNLKNVEGVFYVTIGGIISAILCVIIEMGIYTIKLSGKTGMTTIQAFKTELKAYVNINSNVKPFIPKKSKSRSSKDSEVSHKTHGDADTAPSYGFAVGLSKDLLTDDSL